MGDQLGKLEFKLRLSPDNAIKIFPRRNKFQDKTESFANKVRFEPLPEIIIKFGPLP
jgi:hypothetical protein